MEVKNEKGYLMVSIQSDSKVHSMRAELLSKDEGRSE